MLDKSAKIAILKCDPDQFIPGLDLEMMYKEMQWAAEGYLWEAVQQGDMNLEKIKKDCLSLLEFWKFVYKKREE